MAPQSGVGQRWRPPDGNTAQVGVVDEAHLLVTLKADPDPGTVDVVALDHGAVSGVSADSGIRANGLACSVRIFGLS